MALTKRKSVSVKAAKKNCLDSIVPIPNEFYAGNKEEDLIVPKARAVPMALVLQFMQWGAFISFFTYYSLPVSYIRESTIQADWNYGGPSWNCTPMMADEFYSMRWNYETCKKIVQPRARRAFCARPTEALRLQTLAKSTLALTSHLRVMLGVTTLSSGLKRLRRVSWAQRCLLTRTLRWTTKASKLQSTIFSPRLLI